MTIDHDKRRVEIEGRLEKATPWPWVFLKHRFCEAWVETHEDVDVPGLGSGGFPIARVSGIAEDGDLIANAPADLRYLLDDAIHAGAEIERLKVLLNDAMRVLGRIAPDDVKGDPSWRTEAEIMVSDYRADGDKMSTL